MTVDTAGVHRDHRKPGRGPARRMDLERENAHGKRRACVEKSRFAPIKFKTVLLPLR
jgi:hypothetical protein